MRELDELLARGVSDGVFGCARASVRLHGQEVYSGGTANDAARFDLASVTKVMSGTALACHALAHGALSLDTTVGSLFPEAAAANITVADLMFHRAGLPPYRTYFADLLTSHPQLFDTSAPSSLRAWAREEMLRRHLAIEPTTPPRTAAVYSDVGFILLGAMLERVLAAPLDVLFETHVARPLGLLHCGYRRVSANLPATDVVPTQDMRPREPAPGQQGLWQVASRPSRAGDVDDDNAWMMDGVSAHAGLFSTARDVALFGQAVLDGVVRPPVPWARDAQTPGSSRALGFDTPSGETPSAGKRFGPYAIGHLGFTGTSLWVDLDRQLVVALLTNRTSLGRANLKLPAWRPVFHDAVMRSLFPHGG